MEPGRSHFCGRLSCSPVVLAENVSRREFDENLLNDSSNHWICRRVGYDRNALR